MIRTIASFAICLLLGTAARAASGAPGPLILISMDGYRWDYTAMHPEQTPRLRELMRTGVSTRGLIPVYPTNTFPNHYTIVTGLYPAHHGIINNDLFDPGLQEFFNYKNPLSAGDGRWWGGEPIWVTAEKAGRPSATSFWVGSEAEIGGRRPTFWKKFDAALPFQQRLEELAGWLSLPEGKRPDLVTFYLEETNSIGHKQGIGSPRLVETLKVLDDQVGRLLDRVAALGREPNVIIVSDHGMTPSGLDKVVLLDDYVDLAAIQLEFQETAVGFRPLQGTAEGLLPRLRTMPHARVFSADELPARFRLTGNPRIPPVWIMPDEGWVVMTRAKFEATKGNFNRAEHGYDNALQSMQGILVARGPAFHSDGRRIDPVDNIHVYNLLCAVLGLQPAKNDGDDRLVRALLR